jgi:hypothetical protein
MMSETTVAMIRKIELSVSIQELGGGLPCHVAVCQTVVVVLMEWQKKGNRNT